jgi:hypothetical protein
MRKCESNRERTLVGPRQTTSHVWRHSLNICERKHAETPEPILMDDNPCCYKPIRMEIMRFGKMIHPSRGTNPRQAGETVQMLLKVPPPPLDTLILDPVMLYVLLISPSYAVLCYEIRCHCLQQSAFLTHVTLFKQRVCEPRYFSHTCQVLMRWWSHSQPMQIPLYTNIVICWL